MSEQIKFTNEEIAEIRQTQSNYQTVGLELVQLHLAMENAKKQIEALQAEERLVQERILEINQSEKELAKQLEEKYGKGEIDLESGVFTPVS
jgi:hypothetical protein